jgi:1-acyl-sn-glycerol-3-phosphate acyltransferase
MRGGPIKHGACLVACRAGAPIVPVVVLGTDKLTRVGPWLPFKHARIWMIFGEPVYPPQGEPRRRVARRRMGVALQQRFGDLYRELCSTCGIDDRDVS